MGDPIVTVNAVVINVRDLEKATSFWCTVLGVEVGQEVPGFFVWLKRQHAGGVSVALQLVDHPKPGPNQVHLDTVVPDIAAAVTQIEGLGGSLVAEHQIEDLRWNIMADPEGNEFCIALEHA